MRRRTLLFFAPAALAGPREDAMDVLGAMAAALSEGAADAFIRRLDPAMPHYEDVSAGVAALADRFTMLCSIVLLASSGDEAAQTLDLDWLLELRPKEGGALVRRRERVACKLERRRKRWMVTALEPFSFFRPPELSTPPKGSALVR